MTSAAAGLALYGELITEPYAPASRIATRASAANGGNKRLRAKVSPDFAHGPHDIGRRGGGEGVDGGDRNDAVPGIVQRRADQIVHGGIQYHESATLRLLHQNNGSEQQTRRPDQPAARLDHHANVQIVQGAAYRANQSLGVR